MLPRVAVAAACAVLLAGCGRAAMPPSWAESTLSPRGGETRPLPDFSRRALDGRAADTKALRGRVVVVKFFARYCEPCTRTLPELAQLASDHPEVAVVGVDEDEQESEALEVVSRYRLSFPVVHDGGQVLSGRFRVRELPVTFVADRGGAVRWVGGPGQAAGELARAVEAAGR